MPERIPHDAIADLLDDLAFFCYFSRSDVVTLGRYMSLKTYAQGEVLFSQGDKGDAMGFILSGKLEIRKISTIGAETVLGYLSPGALVGELALIDEFIRSATVIASEESRLAILGHGAFEELLDYAPFVGVKVLKGIAKTLCNRLRITTSRFAEVL
jgi:CRP-like cAMP-binding protein